MPVSPDDVIAALGLERLPSEGGWYRETYRSATRIPGAALPPWYPTGGRAPDRAHATQIYYLVRSGESSALHRVLSDECFHWYMGDPVVQLAIPPEPGVGLPTVAHLGADLVAGQRPQSVVPAGWWQGLCLRSDIGSALHGDTAPGRSSGSSGFALLGCTVSPGFEWEDFELITPEHAATLADRHPGARSVIRLLTPAPGRERA